MDVTCNRCCTEYEFEEALVSPRGTTVKCTQCGHLFKVQRAEPAVAQATSTHWTLRRTDGSTRTLEDLSDLTRLIREGTFGRDDELSRTGQVWRRLGDIEELDDHFIAADRRGPSRTAELPEPSPRGSRPSDGDGPGPTKAESAEEPPALAADARAPEPAPKAQTAHAGDEPGDAAVTASHGPSRAAAQATPSLSDQLDDEPTAVAPTRKLVAAPRDTPATRGPTLATSSTPLASTGSWEAVEAVRATGVRHESRLRASARLLTSAALVAGFAFWFFSLPPSAAPTSHDQDAADAARADPSQRFLASAEAALSSHRVERFEPALVEYIKALAYDEHNAHVLSAISRLRALWAQALLTEAELGQRDAAGRAPGQQEALAQQAREHAQQALHYAELARQADPANPEAQLARSDALRLTGDLTAARSALDRVIERAGASAEALRIAALLALAGPAADLREATQLAARAVEADPQLVRTRLLLARLLVAQGDTDAARAQLRAVESVEPRHPLALRIGQLLEQGEPTEPAAAEPVATEPTTAGTEEDDYVVHGNSLLEAGQLGPAKRMFEHALTLRPDSASAHRGMGRVFIARGRPLQAIDQYVAAALAGDGEALIALADTYRRLGRQREALTAYQSYLQQNPHGPQQDVAKTQLARLEEQFAAARKP